MTVVNAKCISEHFFRGKPCFSCLFLAPLLRAYHAAGIETRPDAGQAVMLPEPYIPPTAVDDAAVVKEWEKLSKSDPRLWLAIGLARFAGLRREEVANCRVGWIKSRNGACLIELRDRPEEKWWSKTGRPYVAQVIHGGLASQLLATAEFDLPDRLIIPDPPGGGGRELWFERVPQQWLRAHGVTATKPLHRLRGLYADEVARLTADAVTARLAAIRAAQTALGHTSSETTQNHYLTPDALR